MKRSHVILAVLLAALLLLPAIQFEARNYYLQIVILVFMSVVLATSYDIVGGHMGYINLGHITFFAVGAYAFGILFNQGMPLVPALAAATVLAVLFAALIAYPFFRLRIHYFALATFALVKLMEHITTNLGWLTGGSNGLKIEAADRTLPVYYMLLATVVLVMLCHWAVGRSKLGLAMKTIREDEEVARDFGVPTFITKAKALIISSVFPGFLGGVYTWYINYIIPDDIFALERALTPIAMAMLGGSGLLVGPVIGAVFLQTAEEIIWTNFKYLQTALLGLVLVLVGLFMPGGLARLGMVDRVLGALQLREEDK
jgi:ABC-type branched-subunit amino acid transport system permease subunit